MGDQDSSSFQVFHRRGHSRRSHPGNLNRSPRQMLQMRIHSRRRLEEAGPADWRLIASAPTAIGSSVNRKSRGGIGMYGAVLGRRRIEATRAFWRRTRSGKCSHTSIACRNVATWVTCRRGRKLGRDTSMAKQLMKGRRTLPITCHRPVASTPSKSGELGPDKQASRLYVFLGTLPDNVVWLTPPISS